MGRRTKPHFFRGEHLDGLYHKPNTNVWRITAAKPKPIEFRCNDELRAVAIFRQWQAKQQLAGSTTLDAVTVKDRIEVFLAKQKLLQEMIANKEGGIDELTTDELQEFIEDTTEFNWTDSKSLAKIPKEILAAHFKTWLDDDPKELAALVGMPQLANTDLLRIPRASINLEDLMEDYLERKKPLRESEVRKIIADFMEKANVRALADITGQSVQDWADDILEKRDYAPATVRDMFNVPKRVIKFGLTRAKYDKAELRRALDELGILVAPENSKTLDPMPISVEHFQILYAAADDQKDQGLLMVMLNLCMYPSEAAQLKWSEINLEDKTFVGVRSKTKVVRIGVLWDRTVELIKKQARKGEYVFRSNRGTHFRHSGLKDRFSRLKRAAAAKLKEKSPHIRPECLQALLDVKMNQIRDGAYTAAIGRGASIETAKLLAGHKTGISDHYLKRDPQMVAPACAAIERHYFG